MTREKSVLFDILNYRQIILNKKYLALCLICQKTLKNTAESRLKSHRRKCHENWPEKIKTTQENETATAVITSTSSSMKTTDTESTASVDKNDPTPNCIESMAVSVVDIDSNNFSNDADGEYVISNTYDECNKVFQRMCNLSRRIQSHNKEEKKKYTANLFTCAECGKVVRRKDNLLRHIKSHIRKREKKPIIRQFICEECSKVFQTKYCLSRHIQSHIKKLEKKLIIHHFICSECHRIFQRKFDLSRHIQSHDKKRKKQSIIDQFTCNECKKVFPRKYCLMRHIQSHIKKQKKITVNQFTCDECQKVFRRKDNLLRHIQSHIRKKEKKYFINRFTCQKCLKIFNAKYSLLRHIQSHDKELIETSATHRLLHQKCLICYVSTRNKSTLVEHYKRAHSIQFQFEDLHFACIDEFEQWKKKYYYREVTWKTATDIVTIFRCHRSGNYEDSCKKNNTKRKRYLKTSGTKKLQGLCPSQITLRQRRSDGFCKATHQIIHVGHDIDNKEELRFISCSKPKEKEIVRQLIEGVPVNRVLQNIHGTERESTTEPQRLRVTNKRDIRNIADLYGTTDGHTVENDPIHVKAFILENQESVLYYKLQGETDSVYQCFQEEDIVLIYQDAFQKDCLLKYGHKFIAFDKMHGMNPYNYPLHTMLVLDSDFEGIPVAYFICNRTDRIAIDVFIQCICEHVGIVRTRTIMSDMDEVYHNSYSSIMGDAEFVLFCAYNVRKAWRLQLHELITTTGLKNTHGSKSRKKKYEYDESESTEINLAINVITDKERQHLIQDIKKELFDLANELDPVLFQEKLTSFLSIDHENAKPFIDYFKKYYAGNVHYWASCFRIHAGANTNMHLKAYHRVLKYSTGNGMKIKTLAAGLNCIKKYSEQCRLTFEKKILRPKVSHKLRLLRKRHKKAAEYFEKQPFTIEIIDNYSWHVGSFSVASDGVQEMYLVEKLAIKECNLYDEPCGLSCTFCKSCFHEYICSCRDSAISNNMCKHIHALLLSTLEEQTSDSVLTAEPAAPRVLYIDIPTTLPDYEMDCSEATDKRQIQKHKLQNSLEETVHNMTPKLEEENIHLFYEKRISELPNSACYEIKHSSHCC